MTAHNTATREYAERRTQFVIDHLERDELITERMRWAARLRSALQAPRQGNLRDWMAAHNGTLETVDTLQATIRLVKANPVRLSHLWLPGHRQVDARGTFVNLGGSRRDYKGMITLASDADLWLGFAPWDSNSVQLICYVSTARYRAELITERVLEDESLGTWNARLIEAATRGMELGR